MKQKFFSSIFITLFCGFSCFSQTDSLKWWNPQTSTFPVIEGQAWPKEIKHPYDRLPGMAEKTVRSEVWDLSHHLAGFTIRFRSSSTKIKIRYQVSEKLEAPHMPAAGVSGIDLYAMSSDGDIRWCAGKFAFGDTIVYDFKNIDPKDGTQRSGQGIPLYLPLYNTLRWLEISVEQAAIFTPLPVRTDKPIVAYGTSILQGGCASRPGLDGNVGQEIGCAHD